MPLLARARALESVVRDVARDAIMPHFLRAVREYKADGSSLTQADEASQQALLERLPEVLAAPVIGEEMTPEEQLECWNAGQEGLWCIDPIDGTTNFSNGIPLFAVSVAYLVNGETHFANSTNPSASRGLRVKGFSTSTGSPRSIAARAIGA